MARYIITSALPYAEGIPHLGNLVGSILPADVYYRFRKMNGDEAIFICGSDQHGTPIEVQAFRLGIAPSELANQMHEQIKKALEKFECEFTFYGKTDEEHNKKTVYEIFEGLDKNGYILKVDTEMAYCNVDKRFISDTFIEGTCPYCGYTGARGDQCENCGRLLSPKELIEPHCRICNSNDIVFKKTTNLAIDLGKLQERIKGFIDKNSKNNWSKNAINHSLGYLKRGLNSREITRDLEWGFPVPYKGFEGKVFYVWFDAVIGYIGITRNWNERGYARFWKYKYTKLVQFMGKDNIEFHTLMWPGILIGSNLGYVLPHTVYAYEYLMAKGLKFSKSRGTGLNIQNAIGIMPADYWRFALMYLLPETSDSDFSIGQFVEVVNNIMNNIIGNFINRSVSLAKSVSYIVPDIREDDLDTPAVNALSKAREEISKYIAQFESIRLREALRSAIKVATIGNEYISSTEPWKLDKNSSRFAESIYVSLIIVHAVGEMLYPFAPGASGRILRMFGEASANKKGLEKGPAKGSIIKPEGETIFHKVTETELKKLEKYSD